MNAHRRARAEKRAKKNAERKAAFEEQCAALRAAGYAVRDKTVSVGRANWLGILSALPFAAAVLAALWFVPDKRYVLTGSFSADLFLFAAALFVSIPVHEGLHALFWAAANGSFRDISFGVTGVTPYCACGRPMGRIKYLAGTLAPFVFLGVLPSVTGLCLSFVPGAVLGIFNIIAAGGDILVAFRAAFSRAQVLCDHPDRCGFYAFYRGGCA